MVQIPETLLDFANNSDCWQAIQIEMFLASFDQARGTHAGALINGIPGIMDNPLIDPLKKVELIKQIRAKAGVPLHE